MDLIAHAPADLAFLLERCELLERLLRENLEIVTIEHGNEYFPRLFDWEDRVRAALAPATEAGHDHC